MTTSPSTYSLPPTELELSLAQLTFLGQSAGFWLALSFTLLHALGFWLVVRHFQKHGKI